MRISIKTSTKLTASVAFCCLVGFGQQGFFGSNFTTGGGGGGTMTAVQNATCHVEPSSSIVCTFGSATTSGNAIIFKVADYYNASDPNSKTPWTATDAHTGCASPCNTAVTDYGPASNLGAQGTGAIYRWSNINGGASHAVTVTFTGGNTYVVGEAVEYSCGSNHCVPDATPIDDGQAVGGAGPAFTFSLPSITTSTANAMVIGFTHQLTTASTYTITSPAVAVNTVTDSVAHEFVTWALTTSSPGAYSVAGTTTGTTSVFSVIAAYKP